MSITWTDPRWLAELEDEVITETTDPDTEETTTTTTYLYGLFFVAGFETSQWTVSPPNWGGP